MPQSKGFSSSKVLGTLTIATVGLIGGFFLWGMWKSYSHRKQTINNHQQLNGLKDHFEDINRSIVRIWRNWRKLYDINKTKNMVQCALNKGFDINSSDYAGNSIIHTLFTWSYACPTPELIGFLYEKGINIKLQNNKGQTPLHLACAWPYIELDVIKELIDRGAGIDTVDARGNMPLHLVDEANIVKLLVEKGAPLEAKNIYGKTPLQTALDNNNWAVCLELLKCGADIKAKSDDNTRICDNMLAKKRNYSLLDFRPDVPDALLNRIPTT